MADLTLASANDSNGMFGEALEFLKLRHTSWGYNDSDPAQLQQSLAQNPAAVRPKGFAFVDSGAFIQAEDLASIGLRGASCLYSLGRKAVSED